MQQVGVFYAYKEANAEGKYNEFKLEQWKTIDLKRLQKAVGGNIEGLDIFKHNLRVYFHEEGMLLDLPSNAMGTRILHKLGLPLHPITVNYSGTMVVLCQEDTGLTDAQVAIIKKASSC